MAPPHETPHRTGRIMNNTWLNSIKRPTELSTGVRDLIERLRVAHTDSNEQYELRRPLALFSIVEKLAHLQMVREHPAYRELLMLAKMTVFKPWTLDPLPDDVPDYIYNTLFHRSMQLLTSIPA